MKTLVGATIKNIRPLTKNELSLMAWTENLHSPAMAIELDNGIILFPSSDEEGNDNGILFGYNNKTKEHFGILAQLKK